MDKYSLLIKKSAAKELEEIPKKDRLLVIGKIQALAKDPRPPNSKKLSGDDKYRIRQGNYRILYEIDDDKIIVTVVKIGDRKDIYRH